jgi:hypothetical protein
MVMFYERQESELQAAETKFLGAIVGKTRRGRTRNTYIRGRAQSGGSIEPNQRKYTEMLKA